MSRSTKLSTLASLPYYAVIFASEKSSQLDGYNQMAERMIELAQQQEGFLGIDSASSDIGITVSYWQSLEDIKNWKTNSEHQVARKQGRETWYKGFTLRVAKVESHYEL